MGHVAYAHLASNPIHKSLSALDEMVNFEWDQGNDHFPPTSLQISNLNSGTGAANVIPATLTCQFNLRYSPEVTEAQIKQKVDEILTKHELDYELEWTEGG